MTVILVICLFLSFVVCFIISLVCFDEKVYGGAIFTGVGALFCLILGVTVIVTDIQNSSLYCEDWQAEVTVDSTRFCMDWTEIEELDLLPTDR